MTARGVRRPAWAEVSRSALTHNVSTLTSILGETSLCAVMKANAYGHGATLIAGSVLDAGADSLGVALVDEGIELRAVGVSSPILVLTEVLPATMPDAFTAGLTLTIGSVEGARGAVAAAEQLGGRHRVHVKVDTGMFRMGALPEQVEAVMDVLLASSAVDVEGLFTHFSVADGSSPEDREFTQGQIDVFSDVAATLESRGVRPRVRHAANSAGVLGYPSAHFDMARVGLALYGHWPAAWLIGAASSATLEPVLSLRARVVAVRRADAGARPSYGRHRALTRSANVATVPFGYADGYPHLLFDNGAEVLINATRYPLAGAVTMDQLVIDCSDDPVQPGDEVVLLGRQGGEEITALEWARHAETITWEILAGIGDRVPRVLVD